MQTTDLSGYTILVTRPEHQAEHLSRLIEAAGGTPLRLPAITIEDNSSAPSVVDVLSRLESYDIAIFISPNAVHYGLAAIERNGALPDALLLATVGKGSARTLQQRLGRSPDLVPEGSYDSDALLMLPALQQVAGKRILIVRGDGGRELLAETLRARGATVEYAEVYRRRCPPGLEDSGWLAKADIITFTSSEAVRNLVAMTPCEQQTQLFDKPLVVISERCAEQARRLGFVQQIRVTPLASDEAIADTLTAWAKDSQR